MNMSVCTMSVRSMSVRSMSVRAMFVAWLLIICLSGSQAWHKPNIRLRRVVNHVGKAANQIGHSVGDVAGDVGHHIGDVAGDVGHKAGEVATDIGHGAQHIADDTMRVVGGALSDVTVTSTGCDCTGATQDCGCCVHIQDFGIDNTICVNFTYLPHDIGIRVSLSVDGDVIFSKEVSARNPPGICAEIPHLKHLASLCVDFYNLDISQNKFSGCVKLNLELVHHELVDVKIGCFHIPVPDVEIADVNTEPKQLKFIKTKPKQLEFVTPEDKDNLQKLKK